MSRSLPLLCLLGLLLAACSSSTAATPQRRPPDVLQWGVVGVSDVPTLDPALASDPTSISVVSLIYGGLVRLDGRLRVRPDGAARWTISHNGKVYTFYLRHHLRFADGRRVTASDFAAALQRSLGPAGSAGASSFYLELIQHRGAAATPAIDVVNATTLRITLSRPAAHFLAELAFPASYVPDLSVVRRYGPNWTDHAAGFGPFTVDVWRHSRYLSLRPNPYYYGGRPPLRQITLRFYPGQPEALAAYRRGAINLVSGLQAGDAVAADPPGLRRIPGLALDYLAFNTAHLPFYRLKARLAFASLWKPSLAAQTTGTVAFPAHTFLPPAFDLPVPLWHPPLKPMTYLAGARYPQARRFPRIALVVPRDPHIYGLAQALSNTWERVMGVTVAVRQLNPSDYNAVLNAHAFDLAIVRWGGDYPDPQDFLGTQLGAAPDNLTGWVRASYDRAILLADSYNPADPRRRTLFWQAAQLATQKIPLLPLDEPAQTAIIRPGLTHVTLTPLGTISGDWRRARFTG